MNESKLEQDKIRTYDLIFSIGEACSCSECLRFHKLQDFSYPFDWLFGSDFEGRINIITSRFENFINKEDLSFAFSQKAVSLDAYKNKFNDITFNHDFTTGVSLDDSYEEVRAKYARRIRRLLSKIDQSKKILLVYIQLPTSEIFISNDILIKAQQDVQKTFPNVVCDLLYLQHDKDLALGNLIYETVSENILKVKLFNKDLREGVPDYSTNSTNLIKVFKNYQLTNQVSTPLGAKLIEARRDILTTYCNQVLGVANTPET